MSLLMTIDYDTDPETWSPALRWRRRIALAWLLVTAEAFITLALREEFAPEIRWWKEHKQLMTWDMIDRLKAYNDPYPDPSENPLLPPITRELAIKPKPQPKVKIVRAGQPKPVPKAPKPEPGVALFDEPTKE